MKIEPVYLGDGVYASFDGYYIKLHIGRHDAQTAVNIEPEVLRKLNEYATHIHKATEAREPTP